MALQHCVVSTVNCIGAIKMFITKKTMETLANVTPSLPVMLMYLSAQLNVIPAMVNNWDRCHQMDLTHNISGQAKKGNACIGDAY